MTTTTPPAPSHASGAVDADGPESGGGEAPLFLRLTARNRPVVVVVDPAVDQESLAVAQGPHHSYREGEALVIEASQPAARGPVEVASRLLVGTARHMPELRVHVHPGTPIEFFARKSTLHVSTDAAVTGRAVGCSATITTTSGPVDLELVATTATITSSMRRGDSQITLKASTACVDLDGGTVLLQATSRRNFRTRPGHRSSHQPAPGVDVSGPLTPAAGGYLLGDTTEHTAATAPRLRLRLSAGAAYLDARP